MTTITGLPPQAYTRDTLVKAVEWWNQQPTSLKERATSADAIVSFYLQACRRASASQEAPLSGEAFKADLKNLALGLKQFEENASNVAPPPPLRSFAPQSPTGFQAPSQPPPQAMASPQPQAAPQPPRAHAAPAAPSMPQAHLPVHPDPSTAASMPYAPASSQTMMPSTPPPAAVSYYVTQQPVAAPPTPMPAPAPLPTPSASPHAMHAQSHSGVMVWNVDPRSAQAAKELQIRLNLGTEIEALRVLITLGVERARALFP